MQKLAQQGCGSVEVTRNQWGHDGLITVKMAIWKCVFLWGTAASLGWPVCLLLPPQYHPSAIISGCLPSECILLHTHIHLCLAQLMQSCWHLRPIWCQRLDCCQTAVFVLLAAVVTCSYVTVWLPDSHYHPWLVHWLRL